MRQILEYLQQLSPRRRLALVALAALVCLTWLTVCLVLTGVVGP
jgi:type II secretory pathway component PulM